MATKFSRFGTDAVSPQTKPPSSRSQCGRHVDCIHSDSTTSTRIPKHKKQPFKAAFIAERQGFEPWVPVRVQRFSRPSRSTTPASFLNFFRHFRIQRKPKVAFSTAKLQIVFNTTSPNGYFFANFPHRKHPKSHIPYTPAFRMGQNMLNHGNVAALYPVRNRHVTKPR